MEKQKKQTKKTKKRKTNTIKTLRQTELMKKNIMDRNNKCVHSEGKKEHDASCFDQPLFGVHSSIVLWLIGACWQTVHLCVCVSLV